MGDDVDTVTVLRSKAVRWAQLAELGEEVASGLNADEMEAIRPAAEKKVRSAELAAVDVVARDRE